MFTMNSPDIFKLEKDLGRASKTAIPFATRNTLNAAAFSAMNTAREDVREKMVTRNAFTVRSIQVEKAKTLRMSRMEARTGSTADYMETQEFGGIKRGQGKQGVHIATSYAAGQGEAQPRTRLPRKGNKMADIQLTKRGKRGMSRKQRNLVAIKTAAASSRKHIFLDLGKTKGIFRVVGGKRRPKIRMVHDMSRKTVIIKRNPWLAPAVKKTEPRIAGLYRDSLKFQAKRMGLFR